MADFSDVRLTSQVLPNGVRFTQKVNFLDYDEYRIGCNECGKRVVFYTMSDIGSRGYMLMDGFWCRKKKALVAHGQNVIGRPVCSAKCACQAGTETEYAHHVATQDPYTDAVAGPERRFRFTSEVFCPPGCTGECVEAEWSARQKYEHSVNCS